MKMDYKKSQFNYIVAKKDCYLIYNTLFNSLTRISHEEYEQYKNLNNCPADLLEEFLGQGIILEESTNELELYNMYVFLSSKYYFAKPNITITPTMECNARCFYCYEENVRCGKMKPEDTDKVIETIKKLDISRGINITWFGGEPLLNQDWMDCFSEKLKLENILFSAFIISNGSKINENVIVKMKKDWNINNIQITLDGNNEEYAKRKSYIDQDSNKIYYQMLQRIKQLSRNGIAVQIRLNIDKKNVESILELTEDIQKLFANDKNISYYPAFLTGSSESDRLNESEKVEIVKRLLIQDNNNKIPVNSYLYKLPKTGACFYNQKNAFSIDTNGNIFICERKLGQDSYAIGNIDDSDFVKNDVRELSGQRLECQVCVFLPKCLGGCQDAYESLEVPCFIDKYIIKAYLDIL